MQDVENFPSEQQENIVQPETIGQETPTVPSFFEKLKTKWSVVIFVGLSGFIFLSIVVYAVLTTRKGQKKSVQPTPIAVTTPILTFTPSVSPSTIGSPIPTHLLTPTPILTVVPSLIITPVASPTGEEQQVTPETPNISLQTGFSFYLPKDWSAKISNQSQQHFSGRFFLPSVNSESTYVEIESIASSRLTENPLITAENTEQEKINNLPTVLTEGTENFQSSNRRIKQAVFSNGGNSLVVIFYRSMSVQSTTEFDTLLQSTQSSNQQVHGSFKFINEVHAAGIIAGIDENKYVKIEVMGDPLPERITSSDTPYKDGYAKFYKFEAFKGQRLTTVAMEDRTTSSQSFIRSELFSEEGEVIDDKKDTRIEFDAPYTGMYYLIVRSFKNREGGYLLKVFDRNQTENLVYLKYADGSERLLDPTKSPPQYGEKEVALLFQFINPVEVIDGRTVRYFAKPKEFETGLGLITTPVKIYAKQETYQDLLAPDATLPENNLENLVDTTITKLSPSKVLIELASGGLLPKNHHIVIMEQFIGRYRFFTENPQ